MWPERDADGCCRCRGRRIRRRIRSITTSPGYILRSRGRRNGNESWAKKGNGTQALGDVCIDCISTTLYLERDRSVRWRIDRAGRVAAALSRNALQGLRRATALGFVYLLIAAIVLAAGSTQMKIVEYSSFFCARR